MNKIMSFLFMFLICGFMSSRQTSADDAMLAYNNALKAYNDAMQQVQRANLRAQKKEIIKKTISLTSNQSRTFWTIYDKYEGQVAKLNDTRLALIAEYLDQYSDISSEKATELINRVMKLQNERHELKRSYMKELGAVLTSKQALRLLLLEHQIDVQLDAQIAAQIPL